MREEFGMSCQALEMLGAVQEKIDESLQINLIGIHCKSNNEIKFMKDHDKIEWQQIEALNQYDLSDADIVLFSQCENRLKEILKVNYENYCE